MFSASHVYNLTFETIGILSIIIFLSLSLSLSLSLLYFARRLRTVTILPTGRAGERAPNIDRLIDQSLCLPFGNVRILHEWTADLPPVIQIYRE